MDFMNMKRQLEGSAPDAVRLELALSLKTVSGIPDIWIERWMESGDVYLKIAAMNACIDRRYNRVEIIEEGLFDGDHRVFDAATEACLYTYIPADIVGKWLSSQKDRFRVAAMNACINTWHLPFAFIRRGLQDSSLRVRKAAMSAYVKRRQFPISYNREKYYFGPELVRNSFD